MAAARKPIVSIALPVYNGEKYLRGAIESLIIQDYADIELIICDNASCDGTADICHEYASQDERIRLFSNEVNIGAAANFNRVFELSQGSYFMWAAHDDLRSPSYVSRCLAELQKFPEAVMCCSEIEFIDGEGQPVNMPYSNLCTLGLDPVDRLREEIFRRLGWYDIYGLIRAEVLRQTGLFTPDFGSDVILSMELALSGAFARIPEKLFHCRVFPKTPPQYMSLLDPSKIDSLGTAPFSGLARKVFAIVKNSHWSDTTKQRVLDVFVHTLTYENTGWRGLIISENWPEVSGAVSQRVLRTLIRAVLTSAQVPSSDLLRENDGCKVMV